MLRTTLRTLLFLLLFGSWSVAQTPRIQTFTAGMTRYEGFLHFYWDAKKGKIWLEIAQFAPTTSVSIGAG